MGFHEETRNAGRDRRARQHGHELALAAGAGPLPARKLHRVRRVKHDRAVGLPHDRQAAHVGHEIVVAERRAPLADHDRLFVDPRRLGRVAGLVDDVDHVVRRHELRFLDVHRLSGSGDRVDEVGLPSEERRRLEHVHRLRDRLNLRNVVNVGQNGNVQRLAHLGQDPQSLVHARAAEALVRRSVRLVEARLEDEHDAELVGDSLERLRSAKLQFLAFDHARAGDEEEWLIKPDVSSE